MIFRTQSFTASRSCDWGKAEFGEEKKIRSFHIIYSIVCWLLLEHFIILVLTLKGCCLSSVDSHITQA
jgi:hypothetical protein